MKDKNISSILEKQKDVCTYMNLVIHFKLKPSSSFN